MNLLVISAVPEPPLEQVMKYHDMFDFDRFLCIEGDPGTACYDEIARGYTMGFEQRMKGVALATADAAILFQHNGNSRVFDLMCQIQKHTFPYTLVILGEAPLPSRSESQFIKEQEQKFNRALGTVISVRS